MNPETENAAPNRRTAATRRKRAATTVASASAKRARKGDDVETPAAAEVQAGEEAPHVEAPVAADVPADDHEEVDPIEFLRELHAASETKELPAMQGDFTEIVGYQPGLKVDGKLIKWPIRRPTGKWLTENMPAAPHGQGERNVFDFLVRDARQILHRTGRWETTNARWNRNIEFCGRLAANILLGNRSGIKVNVVPYSITLYGPGGHFKQHVDSEKVPGQFATLVMQPRSFHEGGELHVEHEATGFQADYFKGSYGDKTDRCTKTYGAAFFCDVEHTVYRVTKGYRMVLVYSLCVAPGSGIPTYQPTSHADVETMARLRNMLLGINNVLGIGLAFKYSKQSVEMGETALKGQDAHLLGVLKSLIDPSKHVVGLLHAMRETHEYNCFDDDWGMGTRDPDWYWEEAEEPKVRHTVYDLDGSPHPGLKAAFDPECAWCPYTSDEAKEKEDADDSDTAVLGEHNNAFWSEPVSEDCQLFTGNEGSTCDQRFFRTLLLFGSREGMEDSAILRGEFEVAIVTLKKIVETDVCRARRLCSILIGRIARTELPLKLSAKHGMLQEFWSDVLTRVDEDEGTFATRKDWIERGLVAAAAAKGNNFFWSPELLPHVIKLSQDDEAWPHLAPVWSAFDAAKGLDVMRQDTNSPNSFCYWRRPLHDMFGVHSLQQVVDWIKGRPIPERAFEPLAAVLQDVINATADAASQTWPASDEFGFKNADLLHRLDTQTLADVVKRINGARTGMLSNEAAMNAIKGMIGQLARLGAPGEAILQEVDDGMAKCARRCVNVSLLLPISRVMTTRAHPFCRLPTFMSTLRVVVEKRLTLRRPGKNQSTKGFNKAIAALKKLQRVVAE